MASLCKFFFFRLIYIFLFLHLVKSSIKLTNIECTTLDEPFADFKSCRLRVPKRGVISMDVHVRLFQIPVNNVSVNLSFWKKASGYRPFLYNISVDFCAFMANKSRYPFGKIFHEIILHHSNVNHTCPFDHDIIVKDLVMDDSMFRRLPIPTGDYMFKLMVGAYNDWKAKVRMYISANLKENTF